MVIGNLVGEHCRISARDQRQELRDGTKTLWQNYEKYAGGPLRISIVSESEIISIIMRNVMRIIHLWFKYDLSECWIFKVEIMKINMVYLFS